MDRLLRGLHLPPARSRACPAAALATSRQRIRDSSFHTSTLSFPGSPRSPASPLDLSNVESPSDPPPADPPSPPVLRRRWRAPSANATTLRPTAPHPDPLVHPFSILTPRPKPRPHSPTIAARPRQTRGRRRRPTTLLFPPGAPLHPLHAPLLPPHQVTPGPSQAGALPNPSVRRSVVRLEARDPSLGERGGC